jgi:hypothetical protein
MSKSFFASFFSKKEDSSFLPLACLGNARHQHGQQDHRQEHPEIGHQSVIADI